MSLRDPSSLQGQVPQPVYDYVLEMWQEMQRLGSGPSPAKSSSAAITALTSTSTSTQPTFNPLTPSSLAVAVGLTGTQSVLENTHANRLAVNTYFAAGQTIGTLFYETDREVTYIVTSSSTGNVWLYQGGVMTAALGSRPADLGVNDLGFQFVDSTAVTQTAYTWTGTAWVTTGGFLQEIADAVTAAITTVLLIRHSTSGAAGSGFGLGVVTQLENSLGANITAAYETTVWSSAATNTSFKQWWLDLAGVLTLCLGLEANGDLTAIGHYIWKSATLNTGTLIHANTGGRNYTFADADGNIVYQTAALVLNNFLFGGGGALAKDSGFSVVPVANGGTNANSAAGARTSLGAAASGPGPGAGTYTVGMKLTGGGTNGQITINADGVITAITQAT